MECRLRAQWLSRPCKIPDTDRLTRPGGRGLATIGPATLTTLLHAVQPLPTVQTRAR